MKRCPRCSQVYSDEMVFCLSDGTPLAGGSDEPEEPTVVRGPRSTPAANSAAGPSFGSLLKYLAAGILLLIILFVLGAAALWIFWPRDRSLVSVNNASTSNSDAATPIRTPTPTSTPVSTPFIQIRETPARDDQKSDLDAQQAELERERQNLAEERRRLEEQKRNSADAIRPETPSFVDPGTVRINFRRGSVGETVAGTIGNARSFVLRTLGGQYLSATIRSAGGCAVFNNGSSSTGYTTGYGDSYLYLRNTCGSPVQFSLTVAVR